jgi:hypothetical protein
VCWQLAAGAWVVGAVGTAAAAATGWDYVYVHTLVGGEEGEGLVDDCKRMNE